jgi:hypothetical protein
VGIRRDMMGMVALSGLFAGDSAGTACTTCGHPRVAGDHRGLWEWVAAGGRSGTGRLCPRDPRSRSPAPGPCARPWGDPGGSRRGAEGGRHPRVGRGAGGGVAVEFFSFSFWGCP